MKYLVGISRIIVGFLFIISGLVKLNDPVGFAFKLQDYFAPDVLNLEFMMPFALPLALLLVIVEVLLGVSLLLGYLKRFTLTMLLAMIVFFTFLTFYSAYFNKVTDCGCFGDAIPLTPWQSFTKDVILLVLILVLVIGKKHIKPFFAKGIRSILVLLSLVFCLGIAYYVLQHLPIIDFRAYKIGANIRAGMEIPEDAPKAIYEYRWKFDVDGEEKIVVTHGDYPDVDGTFVDVDTKKLKEGYTPPITDFSIERDGEDYTDHYLDAENLIVIVAYNLSNSDKQGFSAIKQATDKAREHGYQVIGLSASGDDATAKIIADYQLNFDFYFCDETALKTIVRSNPGILELQRGTVKQKFHWNDTHKLQLTKVSAPSEGVSVDEIRSQLEEIDRKYELLSQLMQSVDLDERIALGTAFGLSESEVSGDLSRVKQEVDRASMAYVASVFERVGYPGKSMVGEPTHRVAWKVLQQNANELPTYFQLIKEAGANNELPQTDVATMEDQYLMMQNKPQRYGTQGVIGNDGQPYIWPIEDPENVDERREAAGFDTTLETYAKAIFGADFEYRVVTMDDLKDD